MPVLARISRHGGAVLGVCGIVLLWASVIHTLDIERRQAMRSAIHDLTNLSRAFDEHIVRSIKAVDQTLLYVRDAYLQSPTEVADLAWWKTNARLLNDPTFQISLIDKAGIFLGSNLAQGAPLDLSDREHFRVQRDRTVDELFISKPVLGRASGKWSIQITRRINRPDGAFAGVVVASFDPRYLSHFYDSVDLGAHGVVSLVGTDGVVRARASTGSTQSGQSVAHGELLPAYARAPSGTFVADSLRDGISRVYAYRGTQSYDLIVVVGEAISEVMADYDANRLSYIRLATLVSVLLLAVSVIIERHLAGLQRARDALRASEARYAQKSTFLEATLEHMSQGIIMVDADRRVQVCNRQAREKLDLPDALMADNPLFDEVIRWQWQRGEFGQDGEDVEAWLRRFVLAGGISENAQVYERTRRSGVTLEFRSVPLQGGGVVRTYTDVTARRETEVTLRAARDEANRAAQAKSEFLAMMSHEIRSPLHGLLGLIELLRDTELGSEQSRMVELAHDSAATLLEIVNDVLDLSKLEASAVATLREPVAVSTLQAALVEPMVLAASRKGLHLAFELADDLPPWIEVDPLRLRQIIGNLLGNAIKFTAAGTVRLAVSSSLLASGDRMLCCKIDDTGIGMSADTLARLFEPFSQADASTTRNFGGTGLGLSISRRLARLLGGDIEVASSLGSGSVFTLTLPLLPAAPQDGAHGTPAAAPADGALHGMRVLVAEDQETNRWLMDRQFSRLGITAVIVADGQQALTAWQAQPFDLLITDCHMPGMDGIELATRIRAIETSSGAPRTAIAGLTADITNDTRERCLAAGMDDMLFKPMNLHRLEAALRRVMARDGVIKPNPPAPEAAPGDPALFDDALYRELFEDAEEDGRAWLDDFIDAADRATESILDATAADDRKAMVAVAHRLAGTSLTAGAMRLGGLARALERRALEATHDELVEYSREIGCVVAATRETILARV